MVAGRVTVDGEPARSLRVVLTPANNTSPAAQPGSSLQALTDDADNFRLAGTPQGTYTLSATSGAYVLQDDARSMSAGKALVVREGEEMKDVELSLKRDGGLHRPHHL